MKNRRRFSKFVWLAIHWQIRPETQPARLNLFFQGKPLMWPLACFEGVELMQFLNPRGETRR
ncbi:MAG: hypothetical protein DWI28_05890, partial [Planctomycetota bacterium]